MHSFICPESTTDQFNQGGPWVLGLNQASLQTMTCNKTSGHWMLLLPNLRHEFPPLRAADLHFPFCLQTRIENWKKLCFVILICGQIVICARHNLPDWGETANSNLLCVRKSLHVRWRSGGGGWRSGGELVHIMLNQKLPSATTPSIMGEKQKVLSIFFLYIIHNFTYLYHVSS